MTTFLATLDIDDIIECNGIDSFNNLVESALERTGQITECDVLEDIGYEVVGVDGKRGVRLQVEADVVATDGVVE